LFLIVLAVAILAFVGWSRSLTQRKPVSGEGALGSPAKTASLPVAALKPTAVRALTPPVATPPQVVPIVEPDFMTAPEVTELNKKVAAYALQEFSRTVGVRLKPLFVIERFEFNSIGPGLVKFRGSTGDGSQALTVLVQTQRGLGNLIAAYLEDAGLRRDQTVMESYGASALFATVSDSEGAHIFVAAEKGAQAYLIAETRQSSSFTSAEVAEFKSQLTNQ
jgi:hypothetical protein